ncbi:hypothetical protein MBLNU230_g0825t1 [Neophaeotheca triangularis]
MFYSESLLAKTGPLARVWLAANLERKLTKQNVLNSDLENNVKDIIGNGQAPMALRLSGQLLLGVARIYSKKARYLLADCSEALLKIKMAFRPGNVDLPGGKQSHTANPNALILPDTITELDLFAPLPEPEDFLGEPETRAPGRDPTLLDFGTSQLLPESQTPAQRKEKQTLGQLHEDDLDLDLGLEDDEPTVRSTPFGGDDDRSVEIGRRAPTPRRDEPSMLFPDDLGLDTGLDDNDKTMRESSVRPLPQDEDTVMLGMDDDNQAPMPMDDDVEVANTAAFGRASATAEERRQRDSASPLSSIRPSVERDLEETFHLSQNPLQREEEEQDETMVQAAQRVKRRKVLQQDTEIELRSAQLRQQQEDRSAITKAPSFLPRDPLLLQLMEMQRSGAFVSSIMGDGRMAGWAPELRGISSIEVVRKAGEKKRKRDSGLPAVDEEGIREETPRLELPRDEDEGFQPVADDFALGGNTTLPPSDGAAPALGLDSDAPLPLQDEQQDPYDEAPTPAAPFDTTEAPLLHPSQSGPVSLGTQTAVHLLRSHLAPEHDPASTSPPTPSKRVKAEALFTDICPEERTSRQDATKMFFELLVLGTKDAVKVEQGGEELGGEIRVRGKRGLWGDWAERGLGASQQVEEDGDAGAEAVAVEV